jgi:hypothetical protein
MRTLAAGFVPPCLPSPATNPFAGAGWLHEIKHDGFRCAARLGPKASDEQRVDNCSTGAVPNRGRTLAANSTPVRVG